MESAERMDKKWRQRREVFADSGVSTRAKERVRRFERFDDEHGFGDRIKFENFRASRIAMESVKSKPVSGQYVYGMKNSGPVSSYIPAVNNVGDQRFYHLNHHGEGTSSHLYHGHEGELRYNHGYDEHARFEDLETDRAELIRKLDELKDKLTRSCDLTDNSKERFGGGSNQRMPSPTRPNPSMVSHHSPYVQEGYICTHGAKTMNATQYGNEAPSLSPCQHCTPYPNTSSYSANLRYSYPQEQHFQELSGYSGPGFQRSPPHHSPSRFPRSPYNHDRFVSQPHKTVSYQPQASCSCVHCCHHQNSHHLSEKVRPAYPNHSVYPAKSEVHSRESLSSGDLNSYKQSPSTSQPSKFKKRVRVWLPIAGGAPVFTCSNCFELLKLPKMLHLSAAKAQQKMKCGACSSVLLFDLGSGDQISSVSERIHKVIVETKQDSRGKEDEDKIFCQGGSNGSDTNTCYEDCDAVADPRFSPKEENPKTCESEDEKKLDNESSDVLPITEAESTVLPNSFSCESSEKYPENIEVNETKSSEVEKAITDESRQSSLKETDTMATEMDVSLNELPNSTISHESEEMMINDDRSKAINSSVAESNEVAEVARSRVSVNGHLIPLHEVKKAEKLAGPIQPGDYWYDSIAGFWGVMGHPCLGIIMPNIGPFDYPMPSNCGAGNTGVYVNGRELYDKDLDLLIRRGLPHTRNRSYIIDMSGKVIDGQTGQEVDSLGKLAPTVEKANHGFGMKVPKYIARLQS